MVLTSWCVCVHECKSVTQYLAHLFYSAARVTPVFFLSSRFVIVCFSSIIYFHSPYQLLTDNTKPPSSFVHHINLLIATRGFSPPNVLFPHRFTIRHCEFVVVIRSAHTLFLHS